MPPEETPGVVAASDEAVHHVHHHSPPPSSVITDHRDHKRKRRNYSVNDDALPPQELTAAWSMIDADRGGTEPAAHTGGAHRSQRRAPAAEWTTDASGSSSRDVKGLKALSSSVALAPPPASSKAIGVKHWSPSFVIGSGKQHPGSSTGGGSHSYYANNNHAAAAPSSSKRLIVLGPAALPPPLAAHHLPAKKRRPPSAYAVPLEPVDDDGQCFRQGVEVFGEWDAATQQAAVDRFVRRQQQQPEGDGFSFWLTPEEAEADLEYVHKKVEEARRTSKAASGSGKPRRH